jgi:hypothetical protein
MNTINASEFQHLLSALSIHLKYSVLYEQQLLG